MGTLLVIADMGEKCSATPRGLQLAAKLGQAVEVVAFTYAPLRGIKAKQAEQRLLRKQLMADRELVVQARIEKFRQPGQKVSLKVIWEKDICRWVNRRCGEKHFLAVVKTGHRSESLVHTSLDWQLLRECPAPVLIVAEKRWHKARPVLACLDLSSTVATKKKLNHQVLEAASRLAAILEVELKIITAIEVPTLLADLDLVDPASYARQARADMGPQIRKLARTHAIPESDFHCKRGPVDRVIASQAAKVHAQLVVMGTVGRKGVKARLLGNTAEQVLRHMKTDVLAIKP